MRTVCLLLVGDFLSLPCSFDLPLDATAAQLADVILLAWRSGLPGISLLQRERVMQAAGERDKDDMPVETGPVQGRVEERNGNAPANADVDTGSSTGPHVSVAAEEVAAVRAETAAAGASLEGMTLAEAERAAVARGHATLVEGYITVGLYPNGSPGDIFLRMTKEGSAVAGLLDSFATAVSLALQHGVPVRVLAEQFAETRFEPSGAAANDQIPYALSIMDYLFRWIELRFLSGHQMDLFANLAHSPEQANAVRVTGTISGPKSSVVPNLAAARTAANS